MVWPSRQRRGWKRSGSNPLFVGGTVDASCNNAYPLCGSQFQSLFVGAAVGTNMPGADATQPVCFNPLLVGAGVVSFRARRPHHMRSVSIPS